MNRSVMAAIVAMLLLVSAAAAWAMPAAFKSFLDSNSVAKIYVELKNSSGDDKIETNKLKMMIEEAFANRKSHRFVVSNVPTDADLVLKADIVEYVWQEVDPVDQVWGPAAAAADAASSDNYARMQARIELVDVKHGRTIWSDKVQANVTKSPMPKEASYGSVYSRFVNRLMTALFRKRVD